MIRTYSDKLKEIFCCLDISSIHIDVSHPIIFLCGGEVDIKKTPPPSVRGRILEYWASNDAQLESYTVLAENFKDYFSDNAYSDLLTFEDDIAKVSSLIIIFLESPGSIAELGLFCNIEDLNSKLIVIAPHNETKNKDSFIYLGPLAYLKDKSEDAVKIYPWPNPKDSGYSDIAMISNDVKVKLSKSPKKEKFNRNNSGHLAFLIHDLIAISQPIRITELKATLNSFGLGVLESEIKRLLYLLIKLDLIKVYEYSGSDYYFSVNSVEKTKFGKDKNDKRIDRNKITLSLRAFTKSSSDITSEVKRFNVLNHLYRDGVII